MRLRITRPSTVLAMVAFASVACGPSPATLASSAGPSIAAAKAVIECQAGMAQGTCDMAGEVALRTVAPSGWTATRVWISSGSLAPIAGLLFDPSANFPAPIVPEGGANFGSAEVAFAETDRHAGMNLAVVGQDIVATLIGYADPHPGWCSGTCPGSSVTDGPFRLELVLSRREWKVDEPIFGTAILSFDGAAPITIYGSGSGVLAFGYSEVAGTHEVEPSWDTDCAPHSLDPATPINLMARDLRLPPGSWDVTAAALFADGALCSGTNHSMRTSERITVGN